MNGRRTQPEETDAFISGRWSVAGDGYQWVICYSSVVTEHGSSK